jgi:hypothetical protein
MIAIAQNRDQIREQVVKFLAPNQLSKWDSALSTPQQGTGTSGLLGIHQSRFVKIAE